MSDRQLIIELEDRVDNLLDVRQFVDARLLLLRSRLAEARAAANHAPSQPRTRKPHAR